MATSSSSGSDIALKALKLDVEQRNRELAFQIASDAAQRALEYKRLELLEMGYLQQQADQFAQQYALQVAQFTFESELAARQLGLTQQAQQFQQTLQTRQQLFEESFQRAQQSGFMEPTPALPGLQPLAAPPPAAGQPQTPIVQPPGGGQTVGGFTWKGGSGIVDGWYDGAGKLVQAGPSNSPPPITSGGLTYRAGSGFVDGWYDGSGRLVQAGPPTSSPSGGPTSGGFTWRGGSGIVDGWYDSSGKLAKAGPSSSSPPSGGTSAGAAGAPSLQPVTPRPAAPVPTPTLPAAPGAGQTFGATAAGTPAQAAYAGPGYYYDPATGQFRWYEQAPQGARTPTFEREQYERDLAEQMRQFNAQLLEQQRQADIGTVMNAPRGPADYLAYLNRLRGVSDQGLLPGAVGQLFQGQPIAGYSSGGESVPVTTNTQLAQGLVGASYGGQPGPWSGGGSPYPASPYGSEETAAAARMLGATNLPAQQATIPQGYQVSLQDWRRMAPTEQQFALGAVSEFGPYDPEDWQQQMQQAAPNFEQSRRGSFGIFG